MTFDVVPTSTDVECFRAAVAQRLGLCFDDSRTELLARVLSQRLSARRPVSLDAYLRELETGEEGREVASLLTVNETYFHRGTEQFAVLREWFRRGARRGRPLRLLSAGCASGEEPYTMAMVAREVLGDAAAQAVHILALDVSPACLARARAGRYSAWSLRETNEGDRARWFRPVGRDFQVLPEVAQMVQFEERNLVGDGDYAALPGGLDVVFCRNVMMYFSPTTTRALVARFAAALRPGGQLFLGHAETLRGVSDAFHLRHEGGAFYYERRGAYPARPASTPAAPLASPSPATPATPGEPDPDAFDWLGAIGGSTRRIEALASGLVAPSVPPVPPAAAAPDTAAALALLREDRFAEALAALPPASTGGDADAALLRAVLLVGAGDVPAARALVDARLAVDDLQAPWHYLCAVCCESVGEHDLAAQHHRVAVYLEPGFAMPHLRLGMLARRRGEVATARRELGQAAVLLGLDDPLRILLFGGGFTRDALVTLCRRELAACPAR